MKLKLLLAFSIGLAMLVPSVSFATDSAKPDEQWVLPSTPDATQVSYVKVIDNNTAAVPNSSLVNYNSGHGVTSVSLCSSLQAAGCGLGDPQTYYASLPRCLSVSDTDCISSFSASIDGQALVVKQMGQFPIQSPMNFVGDPAVDLPTGASPTLVEIPDAPHPGGDLYLIKAQLQGARAATSPPENFHPSDFNVGIYAVNIEDGKFHDFTITSQGLWSSDMSNHVCISISTTQCALSYPLPQGITFNLQVRLHHVPLTWIQGRFKDPIVSISSDSSGNTILDIAALPIMVPTLYASVRLSQVTSAMGMGVPLNGGITIGGEDQESNDFSMRGFLAWLPFANDKAVAMPSSWSYRTLVKSTVTSRTAQCLGTDAHGVVKASSELMGLVTTNASQFIDGPPQFNEQTQNLDYKVAAPHFTPGGDVFKGSYNLVISSTFARCVYDFSSAPISATVSITSESGAQDVATTVVGEKDGFMYLSASGFSFSSPTIHVKLTQEKLVPTPAPAIPSASASPSEKTSRPGTAKPKIKTTITCVHGSTVKKVNGMGPKCPSGFKKK